MTQASSASTHTSRSVQKFAVRMVERPTLADRLLELVARIPDTREPRADDPAVRAAQIARVATAKSAVAAGALALPPGALGWITVAPELYAVWRIQAQMVADIAAAYGKAHLFGREQMLFCLFGHTAASAFEDVVVRVGERYLVRRTPLSGLYAVGNKIAMLIAQRSAGRLVTRWMPVVGALGVAGFVYADTGKVADAAIALFERDIEVEEVLQATPVPAKAAKKRAPAKRAATKSADKPTRESTRKSAREEPNASSSRGATAAGKRSPRRRRAPDDAASGET